MITISLSVNRILETVYAFCAADYFTSKEERPAVLGRGQEAALRRLISNAAAEMIYRLTPPAVGTSLIDEPDADIITIDFKLPEDFDMLLTIRPCLESALAASVMAVAWTGNNAEMAKGYADTYNRNLENLLRTLPVLGKPGRIEPWPIR